MQNKQATLWIMLPVYNEAPRIGELLDRWVETIQSLQGSVRFVLVDDGSSDGSAELLDEFGLVRHGVTVLHHERNMGLGATLRDGLKYVADNGGTGDLLVVMDGDNTQPPEILPGMIAKMGETGCDVVIASRYRQGARVEGVSLFRQLMSLGARALFQIAFPIRNVRDYTCGYRLYRVSVVKRAFEIRGAGFCARPGFDCCADILLQLAKLDCSFQEVPFKLAYEKKGGSSHMSVGRTVVRTLLLLLSHRFGE